MYNTIQEKYDVFDKHLIILTRSGINENKIDRCLYPNGLDDGLWNTLSNVKGYDKIAFTAVNHNMAFIISFDYEGVQFTADINQYFPNTKLDALYESYSEFTLDVVKTPSDVDIGF